jgi:hypothetical protein
MVAGGWALILFMWFGVPTITNDRPFVSAELAEASPRKLHGDLITGTLHRFWDLYNVPLWIAAGGTLIWAALRRNRVVLGLGACAALWVVTEIVFALHGWPGVPRYMFEAAAICGVIAGIGFGQLLTASSLTAARGTAFAGPAIAAALVVALLPYARIRYEQEHDDLTAQRVRTSEINALETTIDRIGGTALIRACGEPSVDVPWVSMLAYFLHMDVGYVGFQPKFDIVHEREPLVVFTAIPYGWEVRTFRTPHADRAECRPLRAELLFTRAHPAGRLSPLPPPRRRVPA